MSEKAWEIKYIEEPFFICTNGEHSQGFGFYKVLFQGLHYGTFGKESLDDKNTDEILSMVECMLNDAHSMARKEHD